MFINRWIDKENVIYTYNEIIFNFRKEGYSAKCENIKKCLGHYTKTNTPVIERHLLNDFIYMKHL